MPRAKKGQQKDQTLMKTTGLCSPRCYYSMAVPEDDRPWQQLPERSPRYCPFGSPNNCHIFNSREIGIFLITTVYKVEHNFGREVLNLQFEFCLKIALKSVYLNVLKSLCVYLLKQI